MPDLLMGFGCIGKWLSMKFILTPMIMCLSIWSLPMAHAQTPPTVIVPNEEKPQIVDLQSGFPNRNGTFSAMLVVIPASELTEFEKPAKEGLKLSQVTSAETGAELAVKLVFEGFGLNADQEADVTYDLLIKAPNGKTYGHSDYRTLAGMKKKISAPEAVFDSGPEVVHLVFEDKDALGVYTLYATITDNVTKRSVPLKITLTHIAKGGVAVVKATPKPKVQKRRKKHR